jgi:RNA polymerase sigma-70 factor (ECF subfamily)
MPGREGAILGGRVNIGGWDEAELVRRCKEGQEAAYAELVRRHRPRLFSLAYRLTGQRETAEDVVQETFIAAFRTMERFEPRPSLNAWLNTILIRAAGRAAERSEARTGSSLDAMLDDDNLLLEHVTAARLTPADDPAAAAEAAELRATLTRAIAGLPFRYRAAVVTRFVLGMDYAEAAAALDTGLNTYKSHLLRGTRILRLALAGEREDADEAAVEVPAPAARPVGYERSVQERIAIERSKPSAALSAAGVGRAPVATLRGENSTTG